MGIQSDSHRTQADAVAYVLGTLWAYSHRTQAFLSGIRAGYTVGIQSVTYVLGTLCAYSQHTQSVTRCTSEGF